VRGLSDRDIESLMQEAGLGKVSKSTASRICRDLRARYKAFCARSLAELELLALFLDAIYLPTRPSGDKEGVLVAWDYTTLGKRVLVAVRLGQRERHEDWLDLGRDLTRRGLRAPWLVVTDGAPGLIKAINELWPEADGQRSMVHRLRNILAKLPNPPELHERIKGAYWAALDEATDSEDGERRLRQLVTTLEPSISAPRPA
jgi:putative transposase